LFSVGWLFVAAIWTACDIADEVHHPLSRQWLSNYYAIDILPLRESIKGAERITEKYLYA